ncbi:sugar ABC transporter ATP-binding protein [Sinosporangium siamense]|uniref:Ribose import ATP-binding protein RbsA n=1 Tax=Sinosporangium siamense TaxID=1367973 RepID=A0A919RNH9_9ACTN|nr:sugar ABC transporter ATP-binding protein [Sinosporangium siamense]GII95244.1 ribose import ATP-binding protein RbsA [Sinosporangium siamense]
MNAVPQARPAAALELTGVSKSFGGAAALREVGFSLLPGEIHALAGINGAGKSTLVKIMSGALSPDGGHLLIAGHAHSALTPRRARALGVSIVHQHRTLVPQLTVAENLFLGRLPTRAGRVDWRAARAQAARALADLGVEVPATAIAADLGPAEQTLVEIAREIQVGGRVLILDEPTATLGGADAARVHRIVRTLSARGIAVVYISHHLDEVLDLADRVTVLRDGRHVLTASTAETDLPSLVRAMTGDRLAETRPRTARTPGRAVLELRDLSAGPRLAGLSLTVRAGEVVAVLGCAGDGQTQLFPLLSGLRRPSGGDVLVGGGRVPPGSVTAALAAGLRCVTGERLTYGLVPGLTVDENLDLTGRGLRRPWSVRWRRMHREAAGARTRFGVTTIRPDPPVATLSGGNQQKVLLARWLDRDVTACLLEEPTNGVDVAAKADIHRLIDGLAARGAAVLLASADVDEVLRLADRVLVVRSGRTVADLPADRVSRDDLVSLSVGGTAS